jgi:hypothetical protein
MATGATSPPVLSASTILHRKVLPQIRLEEFVPCKEVCKNLSQRCYFFLLDENLFSNTLCAVWCRVHVPIHGVLCTWRIHKRVGTSAKIETGVYTTMRLHLSSAELNANRILIALL